MLEKCLPCRATRQRDVPGEVCEDGVVRCHQHERNWRRGSGSGDSQRESSGGNLVQSTFWPEERRDLPDIDEETIERANQRAREEAEAKAEKSKWWQR